MLTTVEDLYFWVLHPVACIIKVIRSAAPRNKFLNMFIHNTLKSSRRSVGDYASPAVIPGIAAVCVYLCVYICT
jgi:hypothetical protein